MANYRVGRVSQEVQKEVSDIIQHKVRDPRVNGITITGVDVTGDLQLATVYYSTLSDDEQTIEETKTGLEKAKGLIQKETDHRLRNMHRTPKLSFERDESIAYGNHIEKLIQDLNRNE